LLSQQVIFLKSRAGCGYSYINALGGPGGLVEWRASAGPNGKVIFHRNESLPSDPAREDLPDVSCRCKRTGECAFHLPRQVQVVVTVPSTLTPHIQVVGNLAVTFGTQLQRPAVAICAGFDGHFWPAGWLAGWI
jgi:hypothetical protein